jgi:hypothetical protein
MRIFKVFFCAKIGLYVYISVLVFYVPASNEVYKIMCSSFEMVLRTNTENFILLQAPLGDVISLHPVSCY